eukprot:3940838-Rhodomonas_salina.2
MGGDERKKRRREEEIGCDRRRQDTTRMQDNDSTRHATIQLDTTRHATTSHDKPKKTHQHGLQKHATRKERREGGEKRPAALEELARALSGLGHHLLRHSLRKQPRTRFQRCLCRLRLLPAHTHTLPRQQCVSALVVCRTHAHMSERERVSAMLATHMLA